MKLGFKKKITLAEKEKEKEENIRDRLVSDGSDKYYTRLYIMMMGFFLFYKEEELSPNQNCVEMYNVEAL